MKARELMQFLAENIELWDEEIHLHDTYRGHQPVTGVNFEDKHGFDGQLVRILTIS